MIPNSKFLISAVAIFSVHGHLHPSLSFLKEKCIFGDNSEKNDYFFIKGNVYLLNSKLIATFAPAIPRRGCLHVISVGSRHI